MLGDTIHHIRWHGTCQDRHSSLSRAGFVCCGQPPSCVLPQCSAQHLVTAALPIDSVQLYMSHEAVPLPLARVRLFKPAGCRGLVRSFFVGAAHHSLQVTIKTNLLGCSSSLDTKEASFVTYQITKSLPCEL